MRYADKTWQEAARMDSHLAILPLGSFEQHGPHLPLGTDIYLIEAIAEGVAERLNAFLLPVQPITTCYEHLGKKGSVHFSADIFYRFIVCIAETLYRKEYHKIVILPGHGGIFILDPAVQYLNAAHPGLSLVSVNPYDIRGLPGYPFGTEGIHADDMETSLMLYIKPDLVDMSKAVDCIPDKPRPYLNYGSIFTLSPSGVWGTPTAATAEKGKWMLENAVEATVHKINEWLREPEGNDIPGLY